MYHLSNKQALAGKENVSPLISLKEDLLLYKKLIKDISLDVLKNNLSNYPIFAAHQHALSLGELILGPHELNATWSIHATTLEELVEKGLVHPDKKPDFKQAYKDPKKFMCILAIVPAGANFVFLPF